VIFTGEYEHTIDDKHRVAIPSVIRSRLDKAGHGPTFYLSPGPNGFLWIWPERTFERLVEALEQSLLPDEETMAFEELLFSQSVPLEMDRTGRVRLPERLLTEHGIGSKVVILGVRNHLELREPGAWSSARPEKVAAQRQIMLRANQAMRRTDSGGE
jgi:MraZ protein